MTNHLWLIEVLDDLEAYAKLNELSSLESYLQDGKKMLSSEMLPKNNKSCVPLTIVRSASNN